MDWLTDETETETGCRGLFRLETINKRHQSPSHDSQKSDFHGISDTWLHKNA